MEFHPEEAGRKGAAPTRAIPVARTPRHAEGIWSCGGWPKGRLSARAARDDFVAILEPVALFAFPTPNPSPACPVTSGLVSRDGSSPSASSRPMSPDSRTPNAPHRTARTATPGRCRCETEARRREVQIRNPGTGILCSQAQVMRQQASPAHRLRNGPGVAEEPIGAGAAT